MSELGELNISENNPLSRETLDTNSFAYLFGTTPENIDVTCGEIINKFDFRYKIISEKERDEIILSVLKTIDSGDLKPSGNNRKGDWEKGWQENLNAFIASNYDISKLSPKYISKYDISRVFSRYVKPIDKQFELNFYTVFRHFLFNTYFKPYKNIFEFGCGSGYNLAIINKLFPDKHLTGLDWAESSVKIADSLGACLHAPISGKVFDYFQPDYSFDIPSGSLVLTLNSLEQLGSDYKLFLDFILKKKPALCINAEPFLEMYDENNLMDYLALKYHKTRNYLAGYYDALKDLESEGIVKINKAQRVHIGNLFHEGYSFIEWNVI